MNGYIRCGTDNPAAGSMINGSITVNNKDGVKKLYLLLDEWDNDRNFVYSELELIRESFDVTVICNSAGEDRMEGVEYLIYNPDDSLGKLWSGIRFFFDKEALGEAGSIIKKGERTRERLSELFHFYINADGFGRFMKNNGCLRNGVTYYSFWYFWKCYAVTRVIDKYPDSRVFTRAHGYDLYDDVRPSGYQPFKERMDERLERIAFISEYGREYYLKRYNKQDCDKYILSCLGTVRKGEGIIYDRDDELLLVSCSHIIPLKRIDRIIRALAMIDDLNVRWIHFGTGRDSDKIKRLAEELLGNKKNISCNFKGQVANSDIHALYSATKVDAFITASESEGNPVSVMEALSYGIPVIAPAICNFPNMIRDCGILLPEKCEPADIAEAVRGLKDMTGEELRKLRDNAFKRWDESYNAEKNNKRFVKEVIRGEL